MKKKETDCINALLHLRWHSLILIFIAAIILGCAGNGYMAERENAGAGALFFTSPVDAVDKITALIKESDWKTLSSYYDLSGSGIKRQELVTGSFFKDEKHSAGPPFFRPFTIRHPFTPGYLYESHRDEDSKRTKVFLRLKIDQGGGMIQESVDAFVLIRSSSGYQLAPEKTSYFEDNQIE